MKYVMKTLKEGKIGTFKGIQRVTRNKEVYTNLKLIRLSMRMLLKTHVHLTESFIYRNFD